MSRGKLQIHAFLAELVALCEKYGAEIRDGGEGGPGYSAVAVRCGGDLAHVSKIDSCGSHDFFRFPRVLGEEEEEEGK